jgi:hypothetical protein
MKKTTPETEEQLRAMIEETRASLEPLIMEQPDKAKNPHQKKLQKQHGTPREFARACVAAIGDISVDEAKVGIARYLKIWHTPDAILPQPVSGQSLLFRAAMRNLLVQLSEGFAAALANGMHRDVMMEASVIFGSIGTNCARSAEKLRAAIKPCGVPDCVCHETQNKMLDLMIEVDKVIPSDNK